MLYLDSGNPAVAKLQELRRKESEQNKRRVKTAPARERRRNWNVSSVEINTTEGNRRLKAPGDYCCIASMMFNLQFTSIVFLLACVGSDCSGLNVVLTDLWYCESGIISRDLWRCAVENCCKSL